MKPRTAVCLAVIFTITILCSCGGFRTQPAGDSLADNLDDPAPWDLIEESDYRTGNPLPVADAQTDEAFSDSAQEEDMLDPNDMQEPAELRAEAAADTVVPTQGMAQGRRARYSRLGPLNKVFNDSNKYHYAIAERIGIRPLKTLADAYYIKRPLVEIKTCALYDVDTLKHSMPYLVPQAAQLLETIARNFSDSLKSRNAPGVHKFRVTSLLRTPHTVKRLRRVNRNATDSSTHQFGTTFDISYARFNYQGPEQRLTDEELKYILAEVLRDLRVRDKCRVKFERHTPCFHITATGR